MLLMFKLAVTGLVIGVLWYVAALIVRIIKGGDLSFDFFVPPLVVLLASAIVLVFIGIVALWRFI